MTQSRNYADSHRVVSINAKRFECGIGYVCMHAPGSWLGAELRREDGVVFTVVELPFHDREKAIPRGLAH